MFLYLKSSINGCFVNWLKRARATQAVSTSKAIRVVDRKGEQNSFNVANENEYSRVLKFFGTPLLRSEDSEYILSFRHLHDGRLYHLPLEDDADLNKRMSQAESTLRNEVTASEQAFQWWLSTYALQLWPSAELQNISKYLFLNHQGERLVEFDAGVIARLQHGEMRLLLGEHKSTLTTVNASELLSKVATIRSLLRGPREEAPEVHDVFAPFGEVMDAKLVVAGDLILPLKGQTRDAVVRQLRRVYHQVLTLSGGKYEPIPAPGDSCKTVETTSASSHRSDM